MVRASLDNEEAVKEASRYVEEALGWIATLHIGPLDRNTAMAADCLRTAAAILEQFGRDRE